MKTILWIIAFVMAVWFGLTAHALTPTERQKLELVRKAVVAGIEHGKILQDAAEQAQVSADNANKVAMMAATAAVTTGLTARKAQAEAERAAKENAEMRPIIKAVTGPWWFPGGNALIYGAKKSIISLIVILVGAFVLFLIIKVAITLLTGGTFSAGLGVVTGIFGKLGRWFGRAFKRLLSFFSRRGKSAADQFLVATKDIEHRTIGSDSPND